MLFLAPLSLAALALLCPGCRGELLCESTLGEVCLGAGPAMSALPGSAALIAKPAAEWWSGMPSIGGCLPSLHQGGVRGPHFGLLYPVLLLHS